MRIAPVEPALTFSELQSSHSRMVSSVVPRAALISARLLLVLPETLQNLSRISSRPLVRVVHEVGNVLRNICSRSLSFAQWPEHDSLHPRSKMVSFSSTVNPE